MGYISHLSNNSHLYNNEIRFTVIMKYLDSVEKLILYKKIFKCLLSYVKQLTLFVTRCVHSHIIYSALQF